MKLNLIFLVPALAFAVGASTNPTYGMDTEFSSLCKSIPTCRTLAQQKEKEEEKRAEFDNQKERKDEHKDEKREKEEKEDREHREVSPN